MPIVFSATNMPKQQVDSSVGILRHVDDEKVELFHDDPLWAKFLKQFTMNAHYILKASVR